MKVSKFIELLIIKVLPKEKVYYLTIFQSAAKSIIIAYGKSRNSRDLDH